MTVLWLMATVLIVSCIFTRLAFRYALSKRMMDMPNERSSHTLPTPRGGGVGFVIAFSLALFVCLATDPTIHKLVWVLIVAGGGVALIGFVDDHSSVPARWRLLGHFLVAVFSLYCLGELPVLDVAGVVIIEGWLSWLLALCFLVWLLNLYNFMDGIDGLASIEAISVCLAMGGIYLVSEAEHLVNVPVLLASSVMGFLVWNFPPARVFMGDVGSGFLGFSLGILALHAGQSDPVLLYCWLIMLSVFIVDATYTLLRRMIRGDRFYEPHRTHAYQKAAHIYGHKVVSLVVLSINALYLFPLCLLVVLKICDPLVALTISFISILMLVYIWGAGEKAA
ncbi:glycosyltransferase family 4 protein [Ectopseudomonas mendocina]|uniref:Glycosyltransferase family 4 protein n=1 Tax=Ectopseudomonas mendocina TaxID=300 RepID=A0ABZ2RRP2_ECTME